MCAEDAGGRPCLDSESPVCRGQEFGMESQCEFHAGDDWVGDGCVNQNENVGAQGGRGETSHC